MRLNLIAIFLWICLSGCSSRPFMSVNVGREYGPPRDPIFVSHVPKGNQWALARTRHHNVFQKIICFNTACCRMIGRRKAMKAISYEDFKKRVRKNAKKGVYKKEPSSVTPPKPVRDTLLVQVNDSVAAESKGSVSAAAPTFKTDSLITLNEFLFATNSFKLNEAHFSELDALGDYLIRYPTLEVTISGHTDNTGNEHHNVSLSTKRAEAVAQYLIEKGVQDEKVYFQGFGSSRPVADNETEQGKSKNRRVEILLSNPKR